MALVAELEVMPRLSGCVFVEKKRENTGRALKNLQIENFQPESLVY